MNGCESLRHLDLADGILEAEELRRATAMVQRKERAVRLLGSEDAPGIGLSELMARLQEEGVEINGTQGLDLAEAVQLEGPPEQFFFRLADLTSDAFDKKLSSIQAENLQARQAEARKREEERQAAQAAQAQSAQSTSSAENSEPEVINDDRSPLAVLELTCFTQAWGHGSQEAWPTSCH